jgi:hypothetical protein
VRNLDAQIAGRQIKLGGADSGSSVRDLMTRLEATLWRVPEPKAGDVLSWLSRVAEAKRAESVFSAENAGNAKQFTMPKPNGAKAFEVMGIPLKRPGLYIVELKSTRLGSILLGAPRPMYVPTAALVTNLAVHFKQGRGNSLVWVTALESGIRCAAPTSRLRIATAATCGAAGPTLAGSRWFRSWRRWKIYRAAIPVRPITNRITIRIRLNPLMD